MRFVSVLLLAALPLVAQSEQKFAELRNLRLAGGETISLCRLGYRTTGPLNADKSNAILWPTWFSGTSDQIASYLGPGKLVDTDRFFVITTDALGNGVSCSPSNQPKPFPAITTWPAITPTNPTTSAGGTTSSAPAGRSTPTAFSSSA